MDQHHLLVTFAAAASLGVFLLILSARLKMSAIVILLIGGIVAGPEFLGLVHPEHLGGGLNTIISLAVGLILFEGGLTLDVKGYRQVSREIWGVLTAGVLVTWAVSGITIKLVFDFNWELCMLAASLIIVTGPTVIGPLLQRIRVKKNLHHILHWEGVLIDPIGVFIALLCFEYYVSTGDNQIQVLLDLFTRFAVGGILGVGFGSVMVFIIQRDWVPREYMNIFVLAGALLNFMAADMIIMESGLLSVTIAGLLVGYKDTPALKSIISYKVELKDFLIGLLFVLLAANLELVKFTAYGAKLIIVVAVVMLIVRPLNIFISMRKSALALKEKLFLSWIAPRGIVAASMASIFALNLSKAGVPNAEFLETFTYSVIAGTVIFQGFTAGVVGKVLGVLEPRPTGWVIVGGHRLGRALAHFIQDQGISVVILDTNAREVQQCTREGLTVIGENAMAIDPDHYVEFYGCGNFLALTPNENLNRLLCQRWDDFQSGDFFRWEKSTEDDVDDRDDHGLGIWQERGLGRWMTMGEEAPPLMRVTATPSSVASPECVLLSFVNNRVMVNMPAEGDEPITMLVIEQGQTIRQSLNLPVQENRVIFSDDGALEPLYGRMLDLVSDETCSLDRRVLLNDLLAREEEFTSLLGHGISMPHAYSKAIDEAIMLVGRAKPGIACKHTGSDIDLVFMLLSPEDEPTEHLERISKIARLIGTEKDRRDLLNAENSRSLFQVIARA